MQHPQFEVIAFHAPVVEGGLLKLVVHTDTGLRILAGTVETWQGGIELLKAALVPASSVPHVAKPGSRHGNRMPEEKRARYLAAFREWKTGRRGTQAECAARHGFTVGALQQYLWLHREGLEAALAVERRPIVKPNGRLL